MKKFFYPASLVMLCLMLSSWGSTGHKKINQNMAACLPARMAFLKPAWTDIVTNNASAADYRKSSDPNESPRHFIDIDNYPEFVQSGFISQIYDSVVAHHGSSFVIDQGILPWATLITFDSVTACFQRKDWNKAALFAADLGHYVGDGHMPLHIAANYNGQFTGQTGVHSRYETTMVGRYASQIVYPVDSAQYIQDVSGYVFNYLYDDYKYVDSVLLADTYATTQAGSTTSDAYYQSFWAKSGGFTILMMRNASDALSNLIYTAWVRAGSPDMTPYAIDEHAAAGQPKILSVSPNPFSQSGYFQVEIPRDNMIVEFRIYDANGVLRDSLFNAAMAKGIHKINWNAREMQQGIYFAVMKSGSWKSTLKFIVAP